jgi:hypothetical protein
LCIVLPERTLRAVSGGREARRRDAAHHADVWSVRARGSARRGAARRAARASGVNGGMGSW